MCFTLDAAFFVLVQLVPVPTIGRVPFSLKDFSSSSIPPNDLGIHLLSEDGIIGTQPEPIKRTVQQPILLKPTDSAQKDSSVNVCSSETSSGTVTFSLLISSPESRSLPVNYDGQHDTVFEGLKLLLNHQQSAIS